MGLNSADTDFDADTGAEHQAEGTWNKYVGKLKANWADLTDDEIGQFKGNAQAAGGYIQEKYGVAKEEFEEMMGNDKE
jgi:uncharacterized protein YjbJ (UPF0337 family)